MTLNSVLNYTHTQKHCHPVYKCLKHAEGNIFHTMNELYSQTRDSHPN